MHSAENTHGFTGTDSQPPVKPSRKIDRYIASEDDLVAYVTDLHNRKIELLAFDAEGDQGNIRYAYSISIFQCYDGEQTAIIDVVKMGNNQTLLKFLTDPAVTKLMFSCANDIFMTQNVLGCTIEPVRDIAVGQKLLQQPINLADHLKIDKKEKESFQRANWLRRPIRPELLVYALNDVLDLFAIENDIVVKLKECNLFATYLQESAQYSKNEYRIDQMLHYKAKFPGFRKLRGPERSAAARVWVFRELLGKHFDCPVGYLLSKKALAASIRTPDPLLFLEQELNRGRVMEKRVGRALVERYYREASSIAGKP